MILVSQDICEYIKPRYLMDCRTKRAVEFMDKSQRLLTVTDDDIDWRSLECVEEEDAIDVARYHLFIYPGDISRYENGMAEVRWDKSRRQILLRRGRLWHDGRRGKKSLWRYRQKRQSRQKIHLFKIAIHYQKSTPPPRTKPSHRFNKIQQTHKQ